jgi:dethiobiotin synthetase
MIMAIPSRRGVFMASTGQHQGKTTTTLGLAANLKAAGVDVGYCKPVGQQHVTHNGRVADKDSVLFAKMLGFDLEPALHSPVILGSGVTKDYLRQPEAFDFEEAILAAARHLEATHQQVIYEGTGHVGVGSVVHLSNARVAKLLGTPAVLVVEGGIGNTLDQISLNLALFHDEDVPVHGVIINKVKPEKLDEIRDLLTPRLRQDGIPVLGYIPYDPTLSYPLVSSVCQAVRGKILLHPEQMLNKVQGVMAGSLIDIDQFDDQEGILLVVGNTRFKEAIARVMENSKDLGLDGSPLAGIVVTGDGRNGRWYEPGDFDHPYLVEHRIPLLATRLETYDTVVMVSRIEVKINTDTDWKVRRAIELFREHVPLDPFRM